MDFNFSNQENFEYLSTKKLGFIYNYIQTVVPFVYDNSLTLFDLLKKLVDYSNEIGKRNNDLANTFADLVKYVNKSEEEQITFINNFVAKLRSEFEDWKNEYNQKYTEFTQEQINNYNAFVQRIETALQDFETRINKMVADFQDQVNTQETNFETTINQKQTKYETDTTNQIQAWQIEIDNMFEQIREMVTTINNEYNTKFNDFEDTINTTLETNNQQLFNLIQSNTQEIYREIEDAKTQINDKISTTNLQPLVDQEIEKYLNDGSVADALKNNYGSIIRITYWDTNTPPTIISDEPVYHYNPDTKVLTDCTNGNIVPILQNSIYMYNGYVYVSEVVLPSIDFNAEEILNINLTYSEFHGHSGNGKILVQTKTDGKTLNIIDLVNKTSENISLQNTFYKDTSKINYSNIGITNDKSYLYYFNSGTQKIYQKDLKTDVETEYQSSTNNIMMCYVDNDNRLITYTSSGIYKLQRGEQSVTIPFVSGYAYISSMFEDSNYYYGYDANGADRKVVVHIIDKETFTYVKNISLNNGKSPIGAYYDSIVSGFYDSENNINNFFYYDKDINKTVLTNGNLVDNAIFYWNGYYYYYEFGSTTSVKVYSDFINNELQNLVYENVINVYTSYVPFYNYLCNTNNTNGYYVNEIQTPRSQNLVEISYQRKEGE